MPSNIVNLKTLIAARESYIKLLLKERGYERFDLVNTRTGYELRNEHGFILIGKSIHDVIEFLDDCLIFDKIKD